MSQHSIEQYFNTVAFSSFEGSLQSLEQTISRSTGTYVTSRDIIEYFLNHNGLCDYNINLRFANGETSITILEINE